MLGQEGDGLGDGNSDEHEYVVDGGVFCVRRAGSLWKPKLSSVNQLVGQSPRRQSHWTQAS